MSAGLVPIFVLAWSPDLGKSGRWCRVVSVFWTAGFDQRRHSGSELSPEILPFDVDQ